MKEDKLKEIFFEKISELMNNFTIESYNIFEKEIKENASMLGFDMDLFYMDGEWLEDENTICGTDFLKNIFIHYNSDEPFIYYDWY